MFSDLRVWILGVTIVVMIVGIGCDLVQIERVNRIWALYGDRFLARFFSQEEADRARSMKNPESFLAGRFAAKEAFAKALGAGFGADLSWQDVSVGTKLSGAPYIVYQGSKGLSRSFQNIHVSIAHDGGVAIAYVVLESENKECH